MMSIPSPPRLLHSAYTYLTIHLPLPFSRDNHGYGDTTAGFTILPQNILDRSSFSSSSSSSSTSFSVVSNTRGSDSETDREKGQSREKGKEKDKDDQITMKRPAWRGRTRSEENVRLRRKRRGWMVLFVFVLVGLGGVGHLMVIRRLDYPEGDRDRDRDSDRDTGSDMDVDNYEIANQPGVEIDHEDQYPIDRIEVTSPINRPLDPSRRIQLDSTHILIPPHSASDPKHPKRQQLPPHQSRPHRLPTEVLEKYLIHGELDVSTLSLYPEQWTQLDSVGEAKMDLVYLWVNSTDEHFQSALSTRWRNDRAERLVAATADNGGEGGDSGEDGGRRKRWRDNGELWGAVRSGVAAFTARKGNKQSGLRGVHVVSGDYPVEVVASTSTDGKGTKKEAVLEARAREGGWTIGQIPSWLGWSSQDRFDPSRTRTESSHSGTGNQGEEGGNPNVIAKDEDSQPWLRWHFHSDIFRFGAGRRSQYDLQRTASTGTRQGRRGEEPLHAETRDEQEKRWRQTALPNFNSFAIETQIGSMEGLSENFLLANDDMFFLKSLSTSDFHHPLFGSVLRLDHRLLVKPELTPELISTPGEWGGLQHAALLVSKRFSSRPKPYPYPAHVPKAMSLSLVQEASTIWAKDMSLAATRGFRESTQGMGDVEMAALVAYLRVERWREALLWIWVVAKVGGEKGFWDESARREVVDVLGEGIEGGDVMVHKRERQTKRDAQRIMRDLGWAAPKATNFDWASLDGHPPTNHQKPPPSCLFPQACLPNGEGFFTAPERNYSAAAVFKHMAFGQPSCGDCLIDALVVKSGQRGLSAFFPDESVEVGIEVELPSFGKAGETRNAKRDEDGHGDKDRVKEGQKAETRKQEEELDVELILPMTRTWQEGDFKLNSVLRSIKHYPTREENPGDTGEDESADAPIRQSTSTIRISLRSLAVRLLSRYTYTLGSTPYAFALVHNTPELKWTLGQLDASPHLAMTCLNDDVAGEEGEVLSVEKPNGLGDTDAEEVRVRKKGLKEVLREWMERRWGDVRVEWESGVDETEG